MIKHDENRNHSWPHDGTVHVHDHFTTLRTIWQKQKFEQTSKILRIEKYIGKTGKEASFDQYQNTAKVNLNCYHAYLNDFYTQTYLFRVSKMAGF